MNSPPPVLYAVGFTSVYFGTAYIDSERLAELIYNDLYNQLLMREVALLMNRKNQSLKVSFDSVRYSDGYLIAGFCRIP